MNEASFFCNQYVTRAPITRRIGMSILKKDILSGKCKWLDEGISSIGTLDNAIQEFSSAYQSWYISHYTILHKYSQCTHDFGVFLLLF